MDQTDRIFGNLDEILKFQKLFLSHLESAYNSELPQQSSFGKVFVENCHNFKVYTKYCVNFGGAVKDLARLETLPLFADHFEKCRIDRNMQKLKLADFLLQPIQRICKYPLHLVELQKYTEVYHADRRSTNDALVQMKNLAEVKIYRKL